MLLCCVLPVNVDYGFVCCAGVGCFLFYDCVPVWSFCAQFDAGFIGCRVSVFVLKYEIIAKMK
jgi:hypothetical protein